MTVLSTRQKNLYALCFELEKSVHTIKSKRLRFSRKMGLSDIGLTSVVQNNSLGNIALGITELG